MSETSTLIKDTATPVTQDMLKVQREITITNLDGQYNSCDQNCGARATNIAFAEGQSTPALMFCKHHARRNNESLKNQGFSVLPDNFHL